MMLLTNLFIVLACLLILAIIVVTIGIAICYITWIICKKVSGWNDNWR